MNFVEHTVIGVNDCYGGTKGAGVLTIPWFIVHRHVLPDTENNNKDDNSGKYNEAR